MMSLASQTLTASGESGTSGTVAVLLATDFATVLATLLCRAMESSVLALRTRCRTCGSSSACEGRGEGRLPVDRVELVVFMQRDVRRRSVQSFGVREETLDKSMPDQRKTSVQRW